MRVSGGGARRHKRCCKGPGDIPYCHPSTVAASARKVAVGAASGAAGFPRGCHGWKTPDQAAKTASQTGMLPARSRAVEFCLRVPLVVDQFQRSIEATRRCEATDASPSLFNSRPGNLNIMDNVRRDAIYARVSSQRQAEEATIQSQVAALENRIQADGGRLEPEMRFLDDGCSGTTLQRPSLEPIFRTTRAGFWLNYFPGITRRA